MSWATLTLCDLRIANSFAEEECIAYYCISLTMHARILQERQERPTRGKVSERLVIAHIPDQLYPFGGGSFSIRASRAAAAQS